MIKERLKKLREVMEKENIDVYYIPTSDDHDTEYVDHYYQARAYMSGFTGSAGVLVVTKSEAGLWTDGRYHIQAAKQLKNSTIDLYKYGLEGVIRVEDFIKEHLTEGGCLGVNGQVITTLFGRKLEEICKQKNASMKVSVDLVGKIWEDRPKRSAKKSWRFLPEFSGESSTDKLKRLRERMKQEGATVHILSELDHIAWLYNVRGNDIEHFPVSLAFAMITMEQAFYYVQDDTFDNELAKDLMKDGITIRSYDKIYDDVSKLTDKDTVWYDETRVNFALTSCIPKNVKRMEMNSPCLIWQATKNETELINTRIAHKKDAVAMIRFLRYIKENIGKCDMTEISASDYLEDLRKMQPDFLDLSFETICAYGANAAMMHYCATPDNYSKLEPKGFLLVDSGAHFKQGSTDITRTIVLGKLTEEEKKMYTLTLKGHFQLLNAVFHEGCSGYQLDILARGPLWDLGIDYLCGTGHGVGNVLSVHEAPNGIRWRIVPERNDSSKLIPGMITTNEPGVYKEGAYGIRLENEMICVEKCVTEYGRFLGFEPITYVPFDRDAIDVSLLTSVDIARVDAYHKMVYETMAPMLSKEDQAWLKEATSPLV